MPIRFLSRGPIDQISGGYLYNRYLVEHLRGAGTDVIYHGQPHDLAAADEDDVAIVDGLALVEWAPLLLNSRARVVLLLHVVPDADSLGTDGARLLNVLYRRSRVVVTGDSTLTSLRDSLTRAGIDAVKIEPGVPGHWRAKETYSERARVLLGVANYIPGKGIGRLIHALAPLRDLPWRLVVRGNRDFDPGHYDLLRRLVVEFDLEDRVELLGAVPHAAVNDEMIGSDLLVHFSEHESYSMVTAEAIAAGLPVLSYRTGHAEAFGRSGLVLHVEKGEEQGALRALMTRPDAYGRYRPAGPRTIRTWQDVGTAFVDWLGA